MPAGGHKDTWTCWGKDLEASYNVGADRVGPLSSQAERVAEAKPVEQDRQGLQAPLSPRHALAISFCVSTYNKLTPSYPTVAAGVGLTCLLFFLLQ